MSEAKLIPEKAKELAAQSESATVMQMIENAATNPAIEAEKMERMFALYERMEAKKAEAEFNASMTAAQGKMGRISADATNPQTKSKYASYPALDRVLRPIYTEAGFALSFDTGEVLDNTIRILCHVSHRGGHSKTYSVPMPADGKGAKGGDVMTKTHATGAAMSYGMRYLLKLIFNVAIGEDDNDGNQPYETVTEKQVADLECMIDEVGADKAAFLKYLKISKLEELRASSYTGAINALEAKRKKANA